MKIKQYKFLITSAFLMVAPVSVWAGCMDDFNQLTPKFEAAHAKMSEKTHVEAERVLGDAFRLCKENKETEANLKLQEVKKIISN